MNLAVSNIAWASEEDQSALALLKELGVSKLEIAPSKVWGDLDLVTRDQVESYLKELASFGLEVVSFQSLLFKQEHLQLFGPTRDGLKERLTRVFEIAYWAGAKPLVFGSPKNRIKGSLSYAEALEQAASFFKEVSVEAEQFGVILCIEPNPEEYGTDFINNLSQAMELVTKIGSPKIRLQLDTGEIFMNKESDEQIAQAVSMAGHLQISEPFLAEVGGQASPHQHAAQVLASSHYRGSVSIEMKFGEDNLARLSRVVGFVRQTYHLETSNGHEIDKRK
jgi:D-psicose/D-tagatose/L-ribulose 3-epimerase